MHLLNSNTGVGAQAYLATINSRPSKKVVVALEYEIARKYSAKRKPGQLLAILRKHDLETLFTDRYGDTLPDNAAGRNALFVAFHHIVNMAKFPDPALKACAAKLAPWIDDDELESLIVKVFAKPMRWKAATLGEVFGLTDADRTRLKIKTIRPIDKSDAERKAVAKAKDREYQAAKRRAAGATSRKEYLATNNLSQAKPWEAEGISRRTWETRRKKKAVTGGVTACDSVTEEDFAQVRREYTSSILLPTNLRKSEVSGGEAVAENRDGSDHSTPVPTIAMAASAKCLILNDAKLRYLKSSEHCKHREPMSAAPKRERVQWVYPPISFTSRTGAQSGRQRFPEHRALSSNLKPTAFATDAAIKRQRR